MRSFLKLHNFFQLNTSIHTRSSLYKRDHKKFVNCSCLAMQCALQHHHWLQCASCLPSNYPQMGPIIYEIAIEIETISLSYQKCKLYNIPSEMIFFFLKLNWDFKIVLTPLCHRLRLNWVSLCKQIIACGWLQSHAKPPHD